MKIYVYNLPSRFNTAVISKHPALQHDFWLVEHIIHQNILNSPVFTSDPSKADLFFIPFYFSCIRASYFYARGKDIAKTGRLRAVLPNLSLCNTFREAFKMIRKSPYWQRFSGKDHIWIIGQGKGANIGHIWKIYRQSIESSIFLGVEARPNINPLAFNLEKDIVIPGYIPWYQIMSEVNCQNVLKDIFMHFRGRCWGPVRPYLFKHIQPRKDIIFTEEIKFCLGGENRPVNTHDIYEYYTEMKRSLFSLCPAGWTPWSKRFYEAILVGSIPVIIPGDFVPPFKDFIDYQKFTVTIPLHEVPELEARLRSIPDWKIDQMLTELHKVRHHFIYHEKPQSEDALDMILKCLARKIPTANKGA